MAKRVISDEQKKKISDSLKGRKFTPEHKQKISQALQGRTISDETRSKLRTVNKVKAASPSFREKISKTLTGRPLTQEHRDKLSRIWKGRTFSEETRKKLSLASSKRVYTDAQKKRMGDRLATVRIHPGTKDTKIELAVRRMLDSLGVKYECHTYFPGIGHPDFYISASSLVIECDGEHWHSFPAVIERDARKDREFPKLGIRIIHLMGNDINKNPDTCLKRIKDALKL